jgi:hypothetical protein
MIRIDELYYNIIVPRVQAKTAHGAHWFDPFGSVRFEDLCNVPPVNDIDNSVRYLFWDQEPLYQNLVDQTLSKFVDMFSQGQRHIVTSEYNSANVDYVQHTYGFQPHYYFFHGWAALDWFRGYNRSYLMPAPEQRTITKTFIAPNRIVAGARQHRLLMLYHMFKNNLHNNWISCPETCPAENISVYAAAKELKHIHPDIEQVFAQTTFPKCFPGEADSPMHSYRLSLFNESAESLLYVVTETVANGRRQHLTEKTFKPICLNMPFVLVGTAGSLNYLRRYGFKTFEHLWDESYDLEINDHVRIEKIGQLLAELDQLSQTEKQQLFSHASTITQHNYEHFYSGGFEQILWAELTNMLEGMGV